MKIEICKIGPDCEPKAKRLHEILANEAAKRAIEVAVAGGLEIVFISTTRAPASELLKAAARIARDELHTNFKGSVIPVCDCGAYGNPFEECSCSVAVMRKHAKVSIPMLRKAFVVIETMEPRASDTSRGYEDESQLIKRVQGALSYKGDPIFLALDGEELLKMAMKELHVDREKVLAVARTIAKLDHSPRMNAQHVSEAIQYQAIRGLRWFDDFEKIEV